MKGHPHPISVINEKIYQFFNPLGFEFVVGPEIESPENNFDKLNIPANHPSRDSQDTFYLPDNMLLRTHTSPVQIRSMKTRKPPVRMISTGRVYRNEATDATHDFAFYQFECLVIDKGISLTHLTTTLTQFLRSVLDEKLEIKFIPTFFPFVEPGVQVNIKRDGAWIELLGAGMVHPNVLKNMGVEDGYTGFAFGIGLERLATLSFGKEDVRQYINSDYRLLGQYK